MLAVIGLATMALPPAAMADPSHQVHVTATAQESGCPGERTFCWETEMDGSISAGDNVKVTVVNPQESSSEHDFFATWGAYDQEHQDTEPGNDSAGTNGSIAPGEETSFNFTVPDDAETLYYWCDISGHEQLGMYGTWNVTASDGGHDHGDHPHDDDTTDGGGSDDGQQSSPGVGLLAALAGLALVAFALGRRD